ncbi:HAD hydrolase-like protein [Cytobacillus sp. Sa5YUA1]|uniref:HAD hydrolase-like protein n=1 Tax=Cytobacillus stercorigallinarum TaxID=2762240 RepID=A0ABR8QQE7_9BACI|nr:HAD hydrolase-like protein [Cytobacillus stercorigallinarum]
MKAVLFDFDGTLANTLPICYAAFNKVFQKFDQRTLSNHEVLSMFGPSETGIIRKHLKHADKEKAISSFYQYYNANHAKLVQDNNEIKQM